MVIKFDDIEVQTFFKQTRPRNEQFKEKAVQAIS